MSCIEYCHLCLDSSKAFLDCKSLNKLYSKHVFNFDMPIIIELDIPQNLMDLVLEENYEGIEAIAINGKDCAEFADLDL
jgi:hypothetical protein